MRLKIKKLSDLPYPEVTNGTLKPNKVTEDDALFSEVIFGPVKSFKCKCKTPPKVKKGERCPDCGVLITSNVIRRFKKAKIKLPFKIIHPFIYDKLIRLNKKNKALIFSLFKGYAYKKAVDKKGNKALKLCNESEEFDFKFLYNFEEFIEYLTENDNSIIGKFLYDNRDKILVDEIIVIPPELRPFKNEKYLDNINKHYALLIEYCNRIKSSFLYTDDLEENIFDENFPTDLYSNYLFKLQSSVNVLYKYCLTKMSGKTGMFRGNMLGKRVDFSGRAVITVDPKIPLTHCGIPYNMLFELFKLNLADKLMMENRFVSVQSAIEQIDECIEKNDVEPFKKDIDEIVENEWVILNRQPSLHRMSMMGFKIQPVDGFSIRINPLITPPFNADFDGDQMAVYVVLDEKAKKECKEKLWSINQLISPANNEIIFTPNQDVILGLFQLTRNELDIEEHKQFVEFKGSVISKGRYIFNKILPDDYPLIDLTIDKKQLMAILSDITFRYDKEIIVNIYDEIKRIGFKYSTLYPITMKFSAFDMGIDREFKKKNIFNTNSKYENYLNEEKFLDELKEKFPYKNMINSGARGNWSQAKQLFLSRGYLADINNKILDEPIIGNNYEGLTEKEYFNSCYGTRKGLIDTAENTAKSGYLTRTLVYCGSGAELNEMNPDCKSNKTLNITISDSDHLKSLHGRYFYNSNNELEMVDFKNKDLIGKQIRLRSPIGCLDKKGICNTCYGELRHILNSRFAGIVAAQTLGEVSTQMVLRTFHMSGAALMREGSSEQSDIISDIKNLFRIFLYGKNQFETQEELLSYIYSIYRNYQNLQYVHFETIISQMYWYERQPGIYSKLRFIKNKNIIKENIRFISAKDVPTYESWFLGCLYSNINKNLLRGIIEKKSHENILARVALGTNIVS